MSMPTLLQLLVSLAVLLLTRLAYILLRKDWAAAPRT